MQCECIFANKKRAPFAGRGRAVFPPSGWVESIRCILRAFRVRSGLQRNGLCYTGYNMMAQPALGLCREKERIP